MSLFACAYGHYVLVRFNTCSDMSPYLERYLAFRANKDEVVVAQTRGKFSMLQYISFLRQFNRTLPGTAGLVIDVDDKLLAIKMTIHSGVSSPMQSRIVKSQVQEKFCKKSARMNENRLTEKEKIKRGHENVNECENERADLQPRFLG